MRLGFIGTGTITQAIVKGLLRVRAPFESISLSPRNAEIAASLAALDSRISVCGSNQEVLDSCDIACLAVVPQIAGEVLGDLRLTPRHHVISFLAGVSIAEVQRMVGEVKAVVRAIPLPAVAAAKGSTALCPRDEVASQIFSLVGAAVEVDDERKFDAISAVTATMASFYAVLETQAAWLVKQGVHYESARTYLSAYTVGLVNETTEGEHSFSALTHMSMTPGGINEQLHNELSREGVYARYETALDNVLKRIEGQT
ncbi:pyrroline-5-carboxylate reductase [Caballeronia terrestris]|jgi:pyrroline-5-carboxylate reductase|uniref:Pyrroline-5-carboxylate reductase n=1 Tax=Caballeronia terrestris TaxID=1226301 RepID=A0A158JM92_9BURK|nr:pyrroline-5-carboxylate reductase [Caballeronia terrestris]SAL69593.1 pyrroline-5-carboxylate reductase [Caballeronia terrestris]